MSVDVEALREAIRDKAALITEFAGLGFESRASARAPVKSGDLLRSIEAGDVQDLGAVFTVTVTCDSEYGLYQDEGTGPIYGDPLLVWEGDDGELVFARKTSGVPATRFWSDTVDEGDEIWREAGASA